MGNCFPNMKKEKHPRAEQLIGKNKTSLLKNEDSRRSFTFWERIRAWLRKASWLVQWKEPSRVCILQIQGVWLMVKLFFFPSLRKLESNCLSQNSTGLQIHLQIPDLHSGFLRLKKDPCVLNQRLWQSIFYSDSLKKSDFWKYFN